MKIGLIDSFEPALAAATRVWRVFFPPCGSVHRGGIKHIRKAMAVR